MTPMSTTMAKGKTSADTEAKAKSLEQLPHQQEELKFNFDDDLDSTYGSLFDDTEQTLNSCSTSNGSKEGGDNAHHVLEERVMETFERTSPPLSK